MAQLIESETRLSPVSEALSAEQQMRQMTRRSLLTGGLAAGVGVGTFTWLRWFANDPQVDSNLPWPLRRMLEFNASISQRIFGTQRLAPQFDRRLAQKPRANGQVGLADEVDHREWKLAVTTPNGGRREFGLQELRQLPRTEMVTELKCVEGWSQIVQWAGVRLVDFLRAYQLGRRDGGNLAAEINTNDLFPYVQLATPDDKYYVGLDMPSAIHPQTLLCYEMNGKPLTAEHGAPLRLAITVKYGIKNIKRIGELRLLNTQPPDYWAERGYDWFAGL